MSDEKCDPVVAHAQDRTATEKLSGHQEDKPKNRSREKATPKLISPETREKTGKAIASYSKAVSGKLRLYAIINTVFIVLNVVFSAIAGIVAGGVGAGGQRAAEVVPGGWQGACYFVASCSLLVTVSTALSGALKIPETVTRCRGCEIELANLLIDFEDSKPEKVIATLKKLRRTYSDLLADVSLSP